MQILSQIIRLVSIGLILAFGLPVSRVPVEAAPTPRRALSVVSLCTEANLRAAVTAGGSVTFNCGGPATIVVTSPIIISANVTIDGGGSVTVSGNHSTGVFSSNNNVTVTFKNLSVINGRSSDQGAGFKVGFWNTLVIENATFSGNVSTRDANLCDGGGALFIGGGSTATISGSTFTNNQANNGGAINSLRTNLTVLTSTFTSNVALHTAQMDSFGDCGGGGAVYIDGANSFSAAGTVTLTGNTFTNNRTNNHGGGVFLGLYANETATFTRNYFNGNRAEKNTQGNAGTGGGLWFGRADYGQPVNALILSNSTFANNHADTQGGGLWVDASANLTNVTFYNNDATNPASLPADDWRRGNGGGIAENLIAGEPPLTLLNVTFANNRAGFNGGAIAGDAASIRNTLFSNNTGGNPWAIQQHCTNALTNTGGNVQYPDRNPSPWYWNETNCAASNLTIADVKLNGLALNGDGGPTLMPQFDSPAVSAGTNCPATDARGVARPQGLGCESGAVELDLSLSPTVAGVGESFWLMVRGAGFPANGQITWNGTPRPTTFINSTTLQTAITAGDLASAGEVAINVTNTGTWRSLTLPVWQTINRLYLPAVRR